MKSRLFSHPWFACLALVFSAGIAFAQTQAESPPSQVSDFAFVQFTDIHVDPHQQGDPPPQAVRGQDTLRWICQQASLPQDVQCYDATAPTPAFAIASGDLTEYGVIGDTWSIFANAFNDLPCPLYVVPGNHDNTWVPMYDIMRRRQGAENYTFDQHGCRFICLDSSSPAEPLPSIDGKARVWLAGVLDKTPKWMPIFVVLHHPLMSTEFATPVERDTLLDMLKDKNVALILCGHGHSVRRWKIEGIDSVMCGSTFGPNAGYTLVNVTDRDLFVTYRYFAERDKDDQSGPAGRFAPLLKKRLRSAAPARAFTLELPQSAERGVRDNLRVKIESVGHVGDSTFEIDGSTVQPAADRKGEQPDTLYDLPVVGLTAGWHLLTVRQSFGDRGSDLRTAEFRVASDQVDELWRHKLPAGIKASPVVTEAGVIVAGDDGSVTAFDPYSGETVWTFTAGAEILGRPAWSGDMLVFGCGDGFVYGLDRSGRRRWKTNLGRPIYGHVLIDHGTAFVGDNGGYLHAIDAASGQRRWTFGRADFAIECLPAVWKDMLVFGAWDGYLYGVGRDDGKLRFKTPGPKSSEEKAARYYAPADCGPAVVGDTAFVCDRGYMLGTFGAGGELKSKSDAGVSAISMTLDGAGLLARTKDDRVIRYDGEGAIVWEKPIPAGRFPAPPTPFADRVYVCSNTGLLSVADVRSGSTAWQYQATSGCYVMGAVAVVPPRGDSKSDEPICIVAGMDGSVTAIRRHPQADRISSP